MKIKTKGALPALELTFGEGDDSFTFLIKQPTFADRIKFDSIGGEAWFRFIAEHLIGWKGITDEDGQPVQFSPGNREAILGQLKNEYARLREFVVTKLYARDDQEADRKKDGSSSASAPSETVPPA